MVILRLCAAALILIAALPLAASAGFIVAQPGDFQPGSPSTGWFYGTNIGCGLGDASSNDLNGCLASATPLEWNAPLNVYAPSGTTAWGENPGHRWSIVGLNDRSTPDIRDDAYWVHPGLAGEFAILGYTLQPGEEGHVFFNGSLTGWDTTGVSDGWDVRIYLGTVLVHSLLVDWSTSPQDILAGIPASGDLGMLVAGQTIYIAIGNRTSDAFDTAILDATLEVRTPEPGSFILLAAGAAALALLRRYSPAAK